MNKIKELSQSFINWILKISQKILPKKIFNIAQKFLTVEIFLYLVFGVLTTIVNIGAFAILTSLCGLEENLSNVIAITLAVLFAYFTNKGLVFNSTASTFSEKFSEFIKFMLGRLFTMVIEFAGFYLMFNMLGIHKLVSKTVVTIVVIILNFFISKFFAFKHKKETTPSDETKNN